MNPKQLESLTHYLTCSYKELKIIKSQTDKIKSNHWGDEHESVLSLWEKSEYLKDLLDLFSKNHNLKKSSLLTIKKSEETLGNLYKKYFLSQKSPKSKKHEFEFGDFSPKFETQIKDAEHVLTIISPDKQKFQKQTSSIQQALNAIKTLSPKSYERFWHFTHTIIPVNNRNIVSYSLQSLPGYSYINLYHRDRLDLMDDLLHENGHHHLNAILRCHTLFNEEDPTLYYSPWRQQMRPLRGIYHAYFTFFWAFYLYRDLFENLELARLHLKLNKTEIKKIESRYHEERRLLFQAYDTLKECRKDKLINTDGWKIVQKLQRELIKSV